MERYNYGGDLEVWRDEDMKIVQIFVEGTEWVEQPTAKQKDKIYEEFGKSFNDILGGDIPRIRKMSDSRKKTLKRIAANEFDNDIQLWRDYLFRVKQSDFLTGKTTQWRATFDWLVKPSNINKVLEGNYDNRANQSKSSANNPADAVFGGFVKAVDTFKS